ncbi:MAG TPA: hypothetical protein ENL03_04650, partial [Phycisphaerae bacterium]|nr:hypothetical protein [Phycisphaerae bacterium]
AGNILGKGKDRGGYCIALGVGSGNLVRALLAKSDMHIVLIEPDPARADVFRREMSDCGLYGRRVSVIVADPFKLPLAPYMASRIVSENLDAIGFDPSKHSVRRITQVLRPYGGRAFLKITPGRAERLRLWARDGGDPKVAVATLPYFLTLTRQGALDGAADWTHNNNDIQNTCTSKDKLVKLPMAVLWFGGPANDDVLPRHGHGPSPQISEGRLFIEGADMLRAMDIYTGRLLWQRELKGLGQFYNVTAHQSGANAIGSNYVSAPDCVYVAYKDRVLFLSPQTGKTIGQVEFPAETGGSASNVGFIGLYEDHLIAGLRPLAEETVKDEKEKSVFRRLVPNALYGKGSAALAVLDRKTGKTIWKRTAEHNYRHNAIVAGGGKIFCIDAMTAQRQKARGEKSTAPTSICAIDIQTGKMIWKIDKPKDVFGTWLAYSSEHDVLLQAGSAFRDRPKDESASGMVAIRGASGEILWRNDEKYMGPVMLRHGDIITQPRGGRAYDLLTGKVKMQADPITGLSVTWQYSRNYGCGPAVAGEHMLTFRSAAAGFYDLRNNGGTGNFGGFKSGCTANLIPAGGVLTAADYTRTCKCAYQNQSSLALVHDPDMEMWTFSALK